MNYEATLSDIVNHVRFLYSQLSSEILLYHNLSHTKKVVAHCREISAFYKLGDEQSFVLLAAAWFHDTGHLHGYIKGHEELSAYIMTDFLGRFTIDADILKQVTSAILVTALPGRPVDLVQEIICDADTYHFGTPDFRKTDELIHKEMELRFNRVFPDWHRDSLSLLKSHKFFTSYCREKLADGKRANIEYIESLLGS